MIRNRTALVLICALAGFAAGCGDDDDDGGGGGGDAPTKAEFIERGDTICAEGDRAVEQEFKRKFGQGDDASKAQLVKFTEASLVPNLKDQSAQLRALPAPEGDGDTVTAIWDALDDGIASLEDDPAQVLEEDPASFEKANKLARAYGFKECGDA